MPQDKAKLTTSLNKKTVPVLKEELEQLGLSTAGKKADLIARLVEHMIKAEEEEATKETSSQEKEETSKDTATDEAPTKAEEAAPTKESKASPAKAKESPERKRSPSPVEEKKQETRSRSASKSPVRKERSPTPPRERMEDEESKDDDKKRKVQESSSSNNGKRQRKWESRGGHNDVSISSDTLDNMITDIPQQEEPKPTNGGATRTSDSGLRTQDTRRVVAKKEKEPELPPDQRPPVPPARKPESRTLFVDRFVRPFLPKQAKELLEKTGEVEYFWMNNIRSHCYVTYKTVEQAVATREAIHGLMWPQANKSRLIVEFSTEEEASRRAELQKSRELAAQPQQQQPQQQAQQQTPTATLTRSAEQAVRDSAKEREKDREKDREREGRDRRDRDRSDRDRSDRDRSDRRERPPPPPKVTLEQLFKKTVARPCIYWMPLTDQEVENKKAAASGASATKA